MFLSGIVSCLHCVRNQRATVTADPENIFSCRLASFAWRGFISTSGIAHVVQISTVSERCMPQVTHSYLLCLSRKSWHKQLHKHLLELIPSVYRVPVSLIIWVLADSLHTRRRPVSKDMDTVTWRNNSMYITTIFSTVSLVFQDSRWRTAITPL